MDIKLKAVKHSVTFSEETNCFQANLYVDGKKVAYVKNDGRGGCTDYNAYNKELRPKLEEAEAYAKTLPPIKYGSMTIDMNLEHLIDDLFDDWLFTKDMNKGIIYGKSKDLAKILSWKGYTISKLLKHRQGITLIKNAIKNVKKEGYTVFNTNLPEEAFK